MRTTKSCELDGVEVGISWYVRSSGHSAMRESRYCTVFPLLRAFCLRVQRDVGWAIRVVGIGGGVDALRRQELWLSDEAGVGLDSHSEGDPSRCHLLAALWIWSESPDRESRARESFRCLRLVCNLDGENLNLEEVVKRPACTAASRSVDGRPTSARSLPNTNSIGIPAPSVFLSLSIFRFCCFLGERREAKSGASGRLIGGERQ